MSKQTETSARFHRFHDTVAIDTESMDETIYLSANMARKMAGLLNAYAREVESRNEPHEALGTLYACDNREKE